MEALLCCCPARRPAALLGVASLLGPGRARGMGVWGRPAESLGWVSSRRGAVASPVASRDFAQGRVVRAVRTDVAWRSQGAAALRSAAGRAELPSMRCVTQVWPLRCLSFQSYTPKPFLLCTTRWLANLPPLCSGDEGRSHTVIPAVLLAPRPETPTGEVPARRKGQQRRDRGRRSKAVRTFNRSPS